MKKILVIEDEAIILLGLLSLLRRNGFEAIGAGNGYKGIQLALEYNPDLILCNIKMPNVNGYQVFEELHYNPATTTIPFLFLTAQNPQPELLKSLPLVPNRYLTKPYDSEELLGVITQILKT